MKLSPELKQVRQAIRVSMFELTRIAWQVRHKYVHIHCGRVIGTNDWVAYAKACSDNSSMPERAGETDLESAVCRSEAAAYRSLLMACRRELRRVERRINVAQDLVDAALRGEPVLQLKRK